MPKEVLGNNSSAKLIADKLSFSNLTLTKLLSLHGMEEELAKKILELIEAGEINSLEDLLEYDYVDEQLISLWKKEFE
jgi:DNA uptake protein ComE-like DNA-binding protein